LGKTLKELIKERV